MGELSRESYPIGRCTFPGCGGWNAWHTVEQLGMFHSHDGERFDFERVDLPGEVALPELGYTSPMPGDDLGYWTIRVAGGGAFLMNAALALKVAAEAREAGPSRDCLWRLYQACEDAMNAEEAKTSG